MAFTSQIDRPFTVEEFAKLPANELRFEVIGGELFEAPSSTEVHQRVLGRLLFQILGHLEEYNLGVAFGMRFDVHLSPYDIFKPDISVVLCQNAARIKDYGVVGEPDLVIEIVFPSSAKVDRVRKAATYATFGVPEYWIVDPDAGTILAQALEGGRFQPIPSENSLIRSVQIAGLVIDPAEIFAVPDWMPRTGEKA